MITCKNVNSLGKSPVLRRTSLRIVANGVVALMNRDSLVVARIYDIALGGFSFLRANDSDLPGSEIRMDILLFEMKNNIELFISQARCRILGKDHMYEPGIGTSVLRFRVKFLHLNPEHRDILSLWIGRRIS